MPLRTARARRHTCPDCGKIRYESPHDAHRAAKRIRGRGGPLLRPYRGSCQAVHLSRRRR